MRFASFLINRLVLVVIVSMLLTFIATISFNCYSHIEEWNRDHLVGKCYTVNISYTGKILCDLGTKNCSTAKWTGYVVKDQSRRLFNFTIIEHSNSTISRYITQLKTVPITRCYYHRLYQTASLLPPGRPNFGSCDYVNYCYLAIISLVGIIAYLLVSLINRGKPITSNIGTSFKGEHMTLYV